MQNKGDRYYFKEASQIINNAFWHSNVDLNVEHGKIEVPLKPTFRVATPLILNNKLQGILIANIIMDNMLDIMANSHNFHVYIIDKDGEVIISLNLKTHGADISTINRIFMIYFRMNRERLSQATAYLNVSFTCSHMPICSETTKG